MTGDATDEALLAAYGSEGCEASFAELHRRWNAPLRCLLIRRFGFDDSALTIRLRRFGFDAYTADEVAQTTWITLAKSAGRRIGHFRSWLCDLARNAGVEIQPPSAAKGPDAEA
ncbi:MAG TPA: hypothetical protein VHX65_16720 [Pirellulales bacterium]|nr:hypothetical protein [Pirellulales bacterium]